MLHSIASGGELHTCLLTSPCLVFPHIALLAVRRVRVLSGEGQKRLSKTKERRADRKEEVFESDLKPVRSI